MPIFIRIVEGAEGTPVKSRTTPELPEESAAGAAPIAAPAKVCAVNGAENFAAKNTGKSASIRPEITPPFTRTVPLL